MFKSRQQTVKALHADRATIAFGKLLSRGNAFEKKIEMTVVCLGVSWDCQLLERVVHGLNPFSESTSVPPAKGK